MGTQADRWLTWQKSTKSEASINLFLDMRFDEIPLLSQPKQQGFRWEHAMNVKCMQILRWSRIQKLLLLVHVGRQSHINDMVNNVFMYLYTGSTHLYTYTYGYDICILILTLHHTYYMCIHTLFINASHEKSTLSQWCSSFSSTLVYVIFL